MGSIYFVLGDVRSILAATEPSSLPKIATGLLLLQALLATNSLESPPSTVFSQRRPRHKIVSLWNTVVLWCCWSEEVIAQPQRGFNTTSSCRGVT